MVLPILACLIPGAVVLLAAALPRQRRASRSTTLAALAWTLAGALIVRALLARPVTIAQIRLDGLALVLTAYLILIAAAAVIAIARRRADPAGLLAAALAGASVVPFVSAYALSRVPLTDTTILALNAASVLAAAVAVGHLARAPDMATKTLDREQRPNAHGP